MTGSLSYTEAGGFDPQHYRIPGENYFESMTPIFRYENVQNELRSLEAGRPVFDMLEVVQFKFAGDNKHSPVFPVDAVYRTINGRQITFAERWGDQYRAFLSGSDQIAAGTPLEELKSYGITAAQLSICRALGVHSIEALDQLEGPGRKRLGVHGNDLKPMAKRWMEARATTVALGNQDEIAMLKAQIAEMRGEATPTEPPVAPVEDAAAVEYMKARIHELTGQRPRGNPSADTLRRILEEAETV